jgi:uncharacterized damage-inducible protein DinB
MFAEEIQPLSDYIAWANHRALSAREKLNPEQFLRPRSFSSVRHPLAHICGAEWIWRERFPGTSPSGLPDLAQFQDVSSLREHWLWQEQRRLGFVRELTRSACECQFIANR